MVFVSYYFILGVFAISAVTIPVGTAMMPPKHDKKMQ
jgi:hypothetical protein